MSTYVVTTRVRVTASFYAIDGALTDTTAVCTVKAPDGTTTTPSVTHASTGVYYSEFSLSSAGTWRVEWQGSVTVIAAGDMAINARASYVDA